VFRPAGRVSLLYRRFSSRPDCRNRPIDRLEWDDPRVANEYAWASSDQERQRLASQGDLLRPATERLFSAAGIGPGARVLDCGSGGGDVSVIVAEMVSPSGEVLGIDRDTAQVEAATRRVNDLGLTNVRFETADLSSPPDGPFDAIVGRLVLMYQPDVEAVLRTLADRLASRGVMAFIEYDMNPPDSPLMWPRSALVEQLVQWVDAAWDVLGNQTQMGTRLPSVLRSAGLEPQLPYELTGAVLTGDAVVEFLMAMIAGIAPVLTGYGIATENEVDTATFPERLKAELGRDAVLVVSGPSLAVWARKP
jgi:ubiquinone/menaquinone biosynthesis C-methylase UbiE